MSKKEVEEQKQEAPKKQLVYVHEPGTVHLNAYEGAVHEAEAKLATAKSELEEAKRALEDKKASSQFVEE